MPLVFEEETGLQIDIDTTGSRADLEQRFSGDQQNDEPAPDADAGVPKKRGRPRLGVVGREITLLPKHWQWLDGQRGGASATLRRLVDKARRENRLVDRKRRSQDRTNRFMSAIAGDRPGYEEATRALYAGNRQRFVEETTSWPADIKATALEFAQDAFSDT